MAEPLGRGLTRPGGISTVTCIGLTGISGSIDRGTAVFELDGLAVLVNGNKARLIVVNSLGGGYHRIDFIVPAFADFVRNGIEVAVKQNDRAASRFMGFPNADVPRTYDAYPADFFVDAQGRILARHASDETPIDSLNPAHPGEQIILYATGMGAVSEEKNAQFKAFALSLYRGEAGIMIGFRSTSPASMVLVKADLAGMIADDPGVYRIDVQVPSGVSGNEVSVTVLRDYTCTVGGGVIGPIVLRYCFESYPPRTIPLQAKSN